MTLQSKFLFKCDLHILSYEGFSGTGTVLIHCTIFVPKHFSYQPKHLSLQAETSGALLSALTSATDAQKGQWGPAGSDLNPGTQNKLIRVHFQMAKGKPASLDPMSIETPELKNCELEIIYESMKLMLRTYIFDSTW